MLLFVRNDGGATVTDYEITLLEGGTVGSLIVASGITLFGVGGQLATLGVLTWLADSAVYEKVFLSVGCCFAAVVVGWFAWATVRNNSGEIAPAVAAAETPASGPAQIAR